MVITRQKVVFWVREASRFFSLQLVVTALNFFIGFLILRYLSKFDYAIYTAAVAILAIFTTATEVGINPAMNAIAGVHHENLREMGAMINTAIAFRTRVALMLAVPVIAYAFWQFWLLGVSWPLAALVIAIVAVGGAVQLQISILRVPILFAQRVIALQWIELKAAVAKVVLGIAVILIYPTVVTLIAVMSLVFIYNWRLISAGSSNLYDRTAPVREEYRKKIALLFQRNFVNTLYWAFQGQILILLCALFASTDNVAEIGAMGKLTAIFMLLNQFVYSYFIPALAKLEAPRAILRQSGMIILFYVTAAVPILTVTFIFPDLLLLILGEKYANLTELLPLFVSISVMTLFQGATYHLCGSRGWVRHFYVYTPIVILAQLILLYFLDLSSLREILYFDGVIVALSIIINVVIFLIEFNQYRRQVANAGIE